MKLGKIYSDVVYEKDIFEQTFGPDGDIYHKPYKSHWISSRGKPIAAYAKVKFSKDSGVKFVAITAETLDLTFSHCDYSDLAIALEQTAIKELKHYYML